MIVLGANASGAKGAPSAPTIGTATVTNATTVSLTFTAPTYSKLPITSYTVTSSPSIALSVSGTSSPLTVTGSFAQATSYTFAISAVSGSGSSSSSSSSNSVTPSPMKFVAMSALAVNPNIAYSSDGITWTTAYSGKSENTDLIGKAGSYFFSRAAAQTTSDFMRYSSDGITWSSAGVSAITSGGMASPVGYAFSTYFTAGWRTATTPNYCYMYTSSTGTGTWTETAMTGLPTGGLGGSVAANSAGTAIALVTARTLNFAYTTTSPTSGWTNYTGFPRTTYGPYGIKHLNDRWLAWGDDGYSYSTTGTSWTASTGNQVGPNMLWTGSNYVGGGSSALMYTSTNGGSTWTSNQIPGTTYDISAAYGAGLVVGLIRNQYGSTTYYTSTNGAGSWTSRTFPFNSYACYPTYG